MQHEPPLYADQGKRQHGAREARCVAFSMEIDSARRSLALQLRVLSSRYPASFALRLFALYPELHTIAFVLL
jgi:hypothetical protein